MKRNGCGTRTGMAAAVAGVCLLLGPVATWAEDAPRPRVAFDLPGGFTVRQGEAAAVTATLEGGSGGMWFSWEGNNGGRAEGDGGATFILDTSMPGEYWLRAVGGSDGTDGDYAGKIRFRVAGKDAAAMGTRAAGAGETTLLSEDFSGMTSGTSTDVGSSGYNGWTGSKMYNGSGCLKIGSSSATGYAQSPVVTNAGSAGRVEYTLKTYGSDVTSVAVTYSTDGGSSWLSLASHDSLGSTAVSHSAEFPESQTVRFRWTGSGKRFYLGPVAVYAAAAAVEENQPPTIDLEPSDTAVELTLGDTYEIDVIATEYDGDTISLDATVPSGATWVAEDPGTGTVEGAFEWTPAATGTYTAVFAAWDKDGTNTQSVVFTVVPEGAGTLAFASGAVNARENSAAALTVLRSGGSTGTVTVAWATANGTATAGSDYTAGSGTLTFAAGETSKSLTVAVLDDSSAENNETFTVTLGNPTGGAALGSPSVCTVTIIDDDDANADYYASCYKNGALKTGDELKNALCQIINTGVTTNSYGSNLDTIFRVTDACPTNRNQVLCIYLQRGISSFNKEHIWAQSHGIDERAPGYSDLHHIRASDSTMNSKRGNLDFDNCQGKSGATEYNGCHYTSTAWEPPDSAKGDVARAMLYMDVRYENKYNSKYDLELVDTIPTSTTGNQFGKLSTLLAWNELDPVDAFETNRNELIYTTYQGNRNPFIDHPDWARAVFDPSNYVPVSAVWTVSATVEGGGWVNGEEGAFTTEVTNGLTKEFFVQPDASSYYHMGSITWNGELVPTAYYTNASYYNYTTPAVTNHSTLAVVFAPDLAALGTPIPWLVQYGTNETSVAGEQWDTAELEDWNDDGVLNWQEYANGTDPTAFSLRQVTNLSATAATSDGFTLGWDAVNHADSYRVRVCSTAVVAAASAGFEGGSVDSGWSTGGVGTTAGTAGAMEGTYALAFATNGAWLCSPAVTNPSSVEFLYKRSTKTNAWTLVVEVSADGGTEWKTVATVADATDTAQTFHADLTAWRGETVAVRLRDARESGAQARYVDAVTVWSGGETVAEGTAAGTSWTATGLEAGTTYGTMVRAEATAPESALGPWSVVVLASTATDDSGRMPQTISFPEIADQIATNTVALGATASSGLPVAYTVAGNAVESGGVLSFTGDGDVTVTASQAGSEVYAPAVSVSRTFTVAKAVQEIAWAEIGDQLETATVALSATATSGGAVEFTVAGGSAAISGNVLTFTGTGEVTVTATQAGGPLWAAAATSQTFTVSAVVLGAPESIWASATNTTDFTAAWSAVDGATGYELTVWTEGEGTTGPATNETVVLSGDFTGLSGSSQLNNGFIEGWTVSSVYASNGAVRIGTRSAQGLLTSPGVEVHGTLRVVSTARAWTGDTGPMWVEVGGVAQSNELTTTYAVFTNEFENLDGWYSVVWRTASGTQHRVLMTSVEATEVSVSEETSGVMVPVAGYEVRVVEGTTCVVTGLTSATEYHFHARATAGSATGAWSATAEVTTLEESGMEGLAQSITFPAIGDQIATNTVILGATASSGLPVTYTLVGNAQETGGVLSFTGDGIVTVTASQAGNEEYAPAAGVSRTFMVTKAAQEIAWAEIGDQLETATVALSASATSGGPVEFAVAGGNAGINGSTLTFTGPGEVTVTATQAGGALWASATASQTFTVSAVALGAPENIWASATNTTDFTAAWGAVEGATGYRLTVWRVLAPGEGGGPGEAVLFETAFEDVAGDNSSRMTNGIPAGWVFTNCYSGTNEIRVGTSSAKGSATVTGLGATGTVRVVTQARAWGGTTNVWMGVTVGGTVQSNLLAATSETYTNEFEGVEGAVAVGWVCTEVKKRFFLESVGVSVLGEGVGGDVVREVVTGYDGLAVTGTVQSVTGLVAETAYEFQVVATAGTATGPGSAVVPVTTLAAEPALLPQNIVFPEIGMQVATNLLVLGATAESGLEVTYTVTGPALLEGNVLTFTGAGTVSVTASQAGNAEWAAAEDVTRTFVVVKAEQSIAFGKIPDQTVGATVTLAAVASSGLSVSYVASGPVSLEDNVLTFTGAGTATITASQSGNDFYEAAVPVVQSFEVALVPQTIDFSAIGDRVATDIVTLSATASSGLVVDFAVTSGPAVLNGSTLTFTGAGEVTVTASQLGNSTYATALESQTFTVTKAAQSIDFPALAGQSVGATVTLGATASSGLPVSYTVSGPATLEDDTLTCTGAGTVTMTASQNGNVLYDAAPSVERSFEVALLAQTIDFPEIAAQVATNTVTLSATATSGLEVTFAVTSGPATLGSNMLTFTGAGTVVVTASQSGGGNYAAAADVTQAFSVTLARQEITFGAIPDQSVTDTVALEATASSGLEISYTVSGPATLTGTTLSFTGAGTVTVTAHQAGNAIWAAAEDVARTFEVSLLAQRITFETIGDQVATNIVTLSATADSGLDVAFAVASGPAEVNGSTLTFTGAGEVTVTATQAGDRTYAAASESQTFSVSKASQSIDFPALADQSVGDTVTLNATASSGLAVSYTVSGPATLEGDTLTCTGAGTVTVTAIQNGNDLYDAAPSVEHSFEVSLLAQTIDFPEIAAQVATNTVTLSATATSGLEVTFAVTSGPATLDGNTLAFTGAGTVVVVASQTGGGHYAAAADVTRSFEVALAVQEITFEVIADQSVTDTVTLEAVANSGLEVSYTVNGPATLTGTTLSFTGAGSVTVIAHQTGNALWAAAKDVTRTFKVARVAQSITFETIGNQVATNIVTLSATADSGLDVAFEITTGPAEVNGTMLTFTGAGEVTVTATQTGNAMYAPVTTNQTFTVSKASQIIDFLSIVGQFVGDTVTLEATASSGLAVSYAVSGPATLEGNTLTCTGSGTVTVTASQGGNDLYAAAEDVVQTFEVTQAETPEETAYEAWLKGLGLDTATYPADGTGENGYGNWQNYVWDIAPTNTHGLEITGMATTDGNLVLTVPLASERRNYAWVWWTALETGENPLDDATEVPLGRGATTMTIHNALPDGGFGLLQATIPE